MGALAMSVLTACRTNAGAAVLIGNTTISEAQIDKAVAGLPSGVAGTTADARNFLTSIKAFNEVARRLAKDKNYGSVTPTSADITSLGAQLKLDPAASAKNEFVLDYAQAVEWRTLLLSKMPDKAPTEAGLMEAFANLTNQQAFQAGTTYAQAKPTIATQIPGLGQAIELQSELEATAKTYDITVNPRYFPACSHAPCGALSFPVFEFTPPGGSQQFEILFLQMGESASPAVLDSPAPPQPAATN
jgi:hypothetical protein